MNRQERLMRMAYKASFLATPKFKIGAIVELGGKVVSFGVNSEKTHPLSPNSENQSPRRQTHAEVKAIINALHCLSPSDLCKATVYVVRRRSDGSRALSKPCKFCQQFMRSFNIKYAYYTNERGEIELLIL